MSHRSEHPHSALPLLARDELDPGERRAVEVHLESCGSCRAEAEAFGRLLRALRAGAAVPPPLDPVRFHTGLREHLAARRSRSLRRAGWSWAPLVPFAAAAALALWVVLPRSGRHHGSRIDDLGGIDPAAIGAQYDLLHDYPLVENLELLEDLDVVQNLDGLLRETSG